MTTTRQKFKHNKKQNVAFLYEILVKELTKSVVDKTTDRSTKILDVIKEFFASGKPLNKELILYKQLYEVETEEKYAEKILSEVNHRYGLLNQSVLIENRKNLSSIISKNFGKSVFGNFVPNYKMIASISQYFNDVTAPDVKIVLGEQIINNMNIKNDKKDVLEPIDNLVLNSFVRRFNEEYKSLHEEQTKLLNKYILSSFEQNKVDLKLYLNEEIGRLKKEVETAAEECEEIKQDKILLERVEKVKTLLESYSKTEIDEDMLKNVLKVQDLVREINDAN